MEIGSSEVGTLSVTMFLTLFAYSGWLFSVCDEHEAFSISRAREPSQQP